LLPGTGVVDGHNGDVIVLAPAYNITAADVEIIVDRLEMAVRAVLD
jgi:adenosylmethionine-8-amino-7-oxononanoate aminotransferase